MYRGSYPWDGSLTMGRYISRVIVSTEPRSSGRGGPENYRGTPDRRSSGSRGPENYLMSPERRFSRWRGLENYGLTCCVNALLQSFIATPELKFLLNRWDSSSVREDALNNVPVHLKGVLGAIRDPSCRAPHKDFLRCLDRQHIQLNVQHDADEVFLAVLNFIHQQMDDKALALEIQSLYRLSVELHHQCVECSSNQSLPGPSYLLSLPLHIRHQNNTLKDCLASFFELQELSGIDNCFCDQCKTRTPFKHGHRILSLPTILCVQLQRFCYSDSGWMYKLNCSVEFQESLDFQDICSQDVFSKDFQKNESTKYSLFAVIVHSGFAMFGHYTAFVRSTTGSSWFYADDNHVGPVSWEAVRDTYGGDSRTAYMLLYRREPTQTQGGGEGEEQEGERQEGERQEGEKLDGEKQGGEERGGEKQEGEPEREKPEVEKLEGERREWEKQEREKPEGEKLERENQGGYKQVGEKQEGEILEGEKQAGEILEGEKLESEKLREKQGG
ncbi:ubl carboxyl-terminal hydrolase 18 isoform X4 [Gadus morhua]|uniref:ubl carboxyl-terminal hydrolase 18 isoform X4 n=1 Tax=Gadus morhua TaxID=8049 RepID=UPI0011B36517|nr:ubl carboxyl-terminal hydrolase 18-like isoform X4 [Gadus morhua]